MRKMLVKILSVYSSDALGLEEVVTVNIPDNDIEGFIKSVIDTADDWRADKQDRRGMIWIEGDLFGSNAKILEGRTVSR